MIEHAKWRLRPTILIDLRKYKLKQKQILKIVSVPLKRPTKFNLSNI